MRYKDYVARVEFDEEAGIFHGEVINTRDVITFQGSSVSELQQEFHRSVDDYLAFCAERGEQPDKPFSGKFVVRVSAETHRNIFMAANRAGLSLNAWVAATLNSVATAAFAEEARATSATLPQDIRSIYLEIKQILDQIVTATEYARSVATTAIAPMTHVRLGSKETIVMETGPASRSIGVRQYGKRESSATCGSIKFIR